MSAHAKLASPEGYETDFFGWTEAQARLLRMAATQGRLPAALDIENVAEEIESLGRADLRAVESQIRNVLVHLLMAISEPRSDALLHWREETAEFQLSLRKTYTASMRRRIDLREGWMDAVHLAAIKLKKWNRPLIEGLPEDCPFSLDYLIAKDFDTESAEAVLAASLAR